MINLGIKNKDRFPKSEPKETSDYDNEVVYPEASVSGKMAEKMGAADLNQGDKIRGEVVLKVKSITKTEANGKVEYSMCICIVEMDEEMAEVEADVDDDLDGEQLPEIPAMASIGASRDGEYD